MSERLYPNVVSVRLSDKDVQRSEAVAKRLRTPRTTLIRRVWAEFLDSQLASIEKTAS